MTTTTLPDLPRRTATERVQRYWLDRRTTVDGEGDWNLWCRGGTVIDPVGRGSEPRQQRDPHGTDQEAALLQQHIGDGSRLVAPPHCRPHIEACAT
ncbi:MAG: hypothetical protein M0013_15090 [Actinomycetota bacterium]|nr:hypothetical protein [Actinomycetota bacterium]